MGNTTEQVYDRILRAASLDDESQDAAIRITTDYEPIGGWEDKISPPTYPDPDAKGGEKSSVYLLETRYLNGEAVDSVLLDNRGSQANRVEEAVLHGIGRGLFFIPHLALEVETHGRPLRITSLQAPHRSRDAYFRDSRSPDGDAFDATEIGAALVAVSPDDATALLRYSPADLVLGSWDSHRELRLATKFPRCYTSELVGYGVTEGKRAAGRSDLIVSGKAMANVGEGKSWTLTEGKSAKGAKKLSELGHGSIPPSFTSTGGVSVHSVRRTATLGFAGLARVRFGSLEEPAARAARALLASLALCGDRLAFARPGLFLRSGCELVTRTEAISWVGMSAQEFTLDRSAAVDLLQHAIVRLGDAGVEWPDKPTRLVPGPELQKAIDRAYFSQPADEESPE